MRFPRPNAYSTTTGIVNAVALGYVRVVPRGARAWAGSVRRRLLRRGQLLMSADQKPSEAAERFISSLRSTARCPHSAVYIPEGDCQTCVALRFDQHTAELRAQAASDKQDDEDLSAILFRLQDQVARLRKALEGIVNRWREWESATGGEGFPSGERAGSLCWAMYTDAREALEWKGEGNGSQD